MATVKVPLYNTATPVLLQKLKSLQLANKCLQINRRMYTKQMMISKLSSDAAKKKIELSNALIDIYTKQISEFTAERELTAQKIYDELNAQDQPPEEYNTLVNELQALNEELRTTYAEQQHIEQNIPEQTTIEQLYDNIPK